MDERRNALAFWLGCAIVTLGVVLHIPMFLMGAARSYVLTGMPMDAGMYWGMALIVVGIGMSAYGLLPKVLPSDQRIIETITPPEDAPLSTAHWVVAGLLGLALVIDVMKPASLGFVTPGMRSEYGLDAAAVAWLPLAALTGTVFGSFVWGALADI
jgi:putative MFS transporter